MKRSTSLLLGIIALALTGCASQSQFLSDKQGMAMQTALSRAKFDLNCQQVSPSSYLRGSRPAGSAGTLGERYSTGGVHHRGEGLRQA